jgi:DMSO reductase anchor subunit
MDFLENLFKTGSGVSSMRWVFIWTYLFSVVVPLSVWAVAYLKDPKVDLPANVLALVSIIIGVVTAGKVVQGFGEGSVKKAEILKNGVPNA